MSRDGHDIKKLQLGDDDYQRHEHVHFHSLLVFASRRSYSLAQDSYAIKNVSVITMTNEECYRIKRWL